MLIKNSILFVILGSFLICQASAACTVRPRREWRTLSAAEQQTYLKAVVKLQNQAGGKASVYDEFAKRHGELATPKGGAIHGAAVFLPWHRHFLRQYEIELQKVDPSIMQPYWGWHLDSQAPEKGPIWGDHLFGSNGNGDEGGNCVTTGMFKNWMPMYPTKACLKRKWDAGKRIGAFLSIELINLAFASAKTYDEAASVIEYQFHASPHNNIGGHMASMYSPNDPIFYLHHGNIDKLWADWQKLRPDVANEYNGRVKCKTGTCPKATPDDILPSYEKVRVKDVLDIKALCYSYEELDTNQAKPPTVPPPKVDEHPPETAPKTAEPAPKKTEHTPDKPAANGKDDGHKKDDHKDDKKDDHTAPKKADDHKDDKKDDHNAPKKTDDKGDPNAAVVVKPIDEKVLSLPLPKDAEHVPDDDRENLNSIRVPDPISEEWMEINGFDVELSRKQEIFMRNSTLKLNRVHGYVSPSALWNRPGLLKGIFEPGMKFYVDLNGARVVTTSDKSDPLQAYADMLARIRKSVNVPIQEDVVKIADQLMPIIGEPVMNKDSAFNPYRMRAHGKEGLGRGDVKYRREGSIRTYTDKISEEALKNIEEQSKRSIDYKNDIRNGKHRNRKHSFEEQLERTGRNVNNLFHHGGRGGGRGGGDRNGGGGGGRHGGGGGDRHGGGDRNRGGGGDKNRGGDRDGDRNGGGDRNRDEGGDRNRDEGGDRNRDEGGDRGGDRNRGGGRNRDGGRGH